MASLLLSVGVMRSTYARLVCFAAAGLFSVANASAQLHPEPYVSGLTHPLAFVQDPSDASIQYIVQQEGRIQVVKNGALQATPLLDLGAAISTGGERGLLGMAMPPDYATSGRFFLDFTNPAGDTVVARFTRSAGNPLVADPASRLDLLWSTGERVLRQPYANHNGGMLAFGPDGYLYIGMGDGGSGDDPEHRAQNMASPLGKILRIDVTGGAGTPAGFIVPADNPFPSGAVPEIWDVGVRNPWRFSFDDPARGGTGALVIGDVGQGRYEEVDYEPAGRGGQNYGWSIREGMHDEVAQAPAFLPLVDPIFEYAHPTGFSITGGYVYRGTALGPGMRGRYVFADFVNAKIWSIALTIDPSTGLATASDLREHTAQLTPGQVSAFGVDAAGEMYFCNWDAGTVVRIASDLPASIPLMSIDAPLTDSTVMEPFALSGWALDLRATASAGIDAMHVWAYPLSTGGPPVFVGVALLGGARPDVGAAFGPQFGAAGFYLTVRDMPPGDYLFALYGLVHATGRFDVVRTVNLRISPGILVSIDTPAAGSTVDRSLVVGGWAIDPAASSGTGIDAVHVWAWSVADPSQYVFLGAPTAFGDRPDVGSAFGAQFTRSGYTIVGTLPSAGSWIILVYPHSSVSGQFGLPTGALVTAR